jgi:hypothetical protein
MSGEATRGSEKMYHRFSEPWFTSLVWILDKKVLSRVRCKVYSRLAVFEKSVFKKLATVLIEGPKTSTFSPTRESWTAIKMAKNT